MTKRSPEQLRSYRWFGVTDLRSFGHRSRTLQMGYAREDFMGKPVIAIINTWSDINPCHAHFRVRVEDVKRGVWQAGGFPIELPALSLSENFVKPTTMLYRNLLALEVEELLRSHPIDGAVLMGGCDKTTPATVMGAISMNLPMIFMPAGPMIRGHHGGTILGSGSDIWKYWAEKEAGTITNQQWNDMEAGIARSPGTCMTMGTASTMTVHRRDLGPEPAGSRLDSGRRCRSPAHGEPHRPSDRRHGVGRSETQRHPHAALVRERAHGSQRACRLDERDDPSRGDGGRAGIEVNLQDFDDFAQKVPVIANLRPSGEWLMEDFHIAGGIRGLLSRLEPLLHLDERTVVGTLRDALEGAAVYNDDVIRPLDKPIAASGGTAILRGNLAPNGCVIKPPAAEARLLQHTGPAIVFDTYDEMTKAVNDLDLDVTPDHIMVLRNAGPIGGPGMPEWGMLPIPKKLLKQGVRDMLRISDARMSGTSYGACILHVSPEAHIGGPLAAVRTGDLITVDVPKRSIHLHVSDEQIADRLRTWSPPPRDYPRGYNKLFAQHIGQAHEGCDFDFLEGSGGVPEPEIH